MFWFAKSDGPIFGRYRVQKSILLNQVQQNRWSRIFRSLDESSEIMMAETDDWRTPLVRYLENLGHIADRKVQRQALKYVVLDNTLYH
jgi:hypothetical protein